MRYWIPVFLAVVLISGASFAQDEKPASQPTTSPAPTGVIPVTDSETISKNVGKELTVRGKVNDTLKRTVILLMFEGVENRNFVAVVKKENVEAVNAVFDDGLDKAAKGKTVTITGPIEMYRGKPEIVISKPDQIKIEPDGAAEEKKPEEKKPEEKKD
jgi:DNA/RNA endonuclease YhcR with UshA esterase domain